MNKVVLVGRLTREPDIRYTQGEKSTCIANFAVAVDRRYKRDGEQSADFPSCVAFGKTGEFIAKYFHKGMRIGIVGRLQTRSYENKDGARVYVTEVVVEEVEFVESKTAFSGSAQTAPASGSTRYGGVSEPAEGQAGLDGFMSIPEGIDEDLPFV